MALSQDIVEATVAAARVNRIDPAALLAVVEIESAGKPYEADGKTPRFLFERHRFQAELKGDARKLDMAKRQGLVRATWNRSTQYDDQATSAERLALLDRAAEIDRECAYRACSWGLGQTMGSNAASFGFASAIEMVEAMKTGGVRAQIDCMVKFIKVNRLEPALARRDWAAFARSYNGKGYAQNRYDIKLAAA
jgi:hypothetical protein